MQRFLVLIKSLNKRNQISLSMLQKIHQVLVTRFGINNEIIKKNSFESILVSKQYFFPKFSKDFLNCIKTGEKKNIYQYISIIREVLEDLLEFETLVYEIKDISNEITVENNEKSVIGYIYLGEENINIYDRVTLNNGDLCLFENMKEYEVYESMLSVC